VKQAGKRYQPVNSTQFVRCCRASSNTVRFFELKRASAQLHQREFTTIASGNRFFRWSRSTAVIIRPKSSLSFTCFMAFSLWRDRKGQKDAGNLTSGPPKPETGRPRSLTTSYDWITNRECVQYECSRNRQFSEKSRVRRRPSGRTIRGSVCPEHRRQRPSPFLLPLRSSSQGVESSTTERGKAGLCPRHARCPC